MTFRKFPKLVLKTSHFSKRYIILVKYKIHIVDRDELNVQSCPHRPPLASLSLIFAFTVSLFRRFIRQSIKAGLRGS